MPPSRPNYSGTTYLLTRRCSERRFFLLPTAQVSQVFAYALAVAASRSGVLVHAVCVMSNHYHLVVTDPTGRISEFYHYLHEFTAKPLNAARGRWENMWSSERTSRVRLEDADAVNRMVRYTLCNPVSSLVLAFARKWPGLRLWWNEQPLEVKRPTVFFREKGPMPKTATVTFVPPPHLESEPDHGVGLIASDVENHEKALRDDARRKGKKFVGIANLRRQKWNECPTSFAARRKLSPRIATRCKWRRLEATARDKQFAADYADARRQWRAGVRDVLWPCGTYLMRTLHNVPCHPPPPD